MCVELEERIERQELDARALEDLGARHAGEDLLHDAVGAPVAVGDRVLQEPATGVDEPVVHSPRIDAHRLQMHPVLRGGAPRPPQSLVDAFQQPSEVPAQVAVVEPRCVVEAVHLLEADSVLSRPADEGPAAARAEIEGDAQGRRAHDAPLSR
jgi:hypothetical protein